MAWYDDWFTATLPEGVEAFTPDPNTPTDASGNVVIDEVSNPVSDADVASFVKVFPEYSNFFASLGSGLGDWVKKNASNLVAAGGGIASILARQSQKPVGYQGDIPSYTMVRSQVPTYDPNRQPGSSGRTYFTDSQYVSGDVGAAKENANKQAEALAAANAANPAVKTRNPAWGYADGGSIDVGGYASNGNPPPIIPPHIEYQMQQQNFARGGIANLAGGNYLAGNTDGMADKIPATIAGKQPAKLSHGEFVVPADVVSHLGNGNSEAGADRLYSMMDKIRQARTGTKKQGKQINPNKFLPG